MKTACYLLFALLISTTVFAREDIYVSLSGGLGRANADSRYFGPANEDKDQSTIAHRNLKVVAGYQTGHWRFQMGVQSFNSGYQLKALVTAGDIEPDKPAAAEPAQYRLSYRHVALPLEVAYEIPLGHRLRLAPAAGLLTTYNTEASVRLTKENGTDLFHETLSGPDFDKQYNRISLWGTAAFYIEYRLNDKFSFFGGPSARYMISNLEKRSDNTISFTGAQRSYCASFDIGASLSLWWLTSKKS
ncbi:outer membrane beta-barrel protein [Taibaiella koreensis]|uniref:outer membrane beta-barrel protein n=1 Tax=Taibaiella koreensis TaxID=1268548 RepID=UPI000E59AD34|nr:outer membrane beta-barrel protein [Taibaiella koreensis]